MHTGSCDAIKASAGCVISSSAQCGESTELAFAPSGSSGALLCEVSLTGLPLPIIFPQASSLSAMVS